jgi:methylated-DNA-[protein]-cysteine S-methyltransferase
MRIEVFGEELELEENLVEESEEEIRRQVEEYLSGGREDFDLKFSIPENFTGEVLNEMLEISRSETKSYGEIAESLGSAAIAVGQACGRNPLPVVVPCHRVVSASGLGGYHGEMDSEVKKSLLELEGAEIFD